MIKEFREFIMRGNVMDLAVAVIIGGAFTAIINSLVADIIMPLAKRLAAGARSDLAVRLLQPFVREQQQHKLHLTAALYAAHLVAQTLNKPTVARQFLANLKRLYPHEPLIDQQLKRLPT